MTYVGLYSGAVSPKLIATSDDPELVELVAQRMLASDDEADPDPAVRELERGRRLALERISETRRPKLTLVE